MSDDFVSDLIEEQGNPNGLLLQILSAGYEQWSAVIAVEGPDDVPFYFDFVSRHIKGETYFLKCGGKDALIKFKGVAESYAWAVPPPIVYLCDKDFDDYIGKTVDGVWYTDRYSIESFVSSRDYIEYILKKYSSGTLCPDDRAAFLCKFDEEMERLLRRVRAYSAFACEVRARGEHPEFDLFGIDKLFVLSDCRVPASRERLSEARRIMDISTQVSFRETLTRARTFVLTDWHKWLRGKLALQLARKSYERAARTCSPEIRRSLPTGPVLGPEALRNVGVFLDDLPGLGQYCREALH